MVEPVQGEDLPEHDANCYLCPGNTRANGQVNPHYKDNYVFENDFAAVSTPTEAPSSHSDESGLLQSQSISGQCLVNCFTPRHDLSMSRLSTADIGKIVQTWIATYDRLKQRDDINYVQVFENKGAVMGCSTRHGQIWALSRVPTELTTELAQQRAYFDQHHACLLCTYVNVDCASSSSPRLVVANTSFAAVVPYWAVWPFEVLVVPRRHCTTLGALSADEVSALADILKQVTVKYDNLFKCKFPYSMGVHQEPTDGANYDQYSHMHIHFYPPLLRSATVKKFQVGFEMLCEKQRDLTPEKAAEMLRALSGTQHYKDTQ
ncbi:hypothetical protein RI367_000442 [Sorochytrium milnesiophthora]